MLNGLRTRTTVICVLLVALAATLGATLAAGADEPRAVQDYSLSGTPVDGVRPTALGLPDIGQHGTSGPAEMAPALAEYHDSGRYERDVAAVARQAQDYLARRLEASSAPAKPVRTCEVRYRRVKRAAGRPALYRRTRACRTVQGASEAIAGKPAIVLDIDETSLSNYAFLAATGFQSAGAGLAAATAAGQDPPLKPVLDVFRYAKEHGVATFFITGRPSFANPQTEANLKAAGYTGYDKLFNKPGDKGTLAFKAGQRAELEKQGYTIVANIGDQDSDLAGGHAERAFKIPNPYYFISE